MNRGIYFEDLKVGQVLRSERGIVMERERILSFAREFDPQPAHLGEDEAAGSQFGRFIASGWHTAGVTMRLITEVAPIAGGGIGAGADVRWLRPVEPGDTLSIAIEVLDMRPSGSRPDKGLVTMRTTTLNQRGEPVQEIVSKVLLPRRP